MAGMMSWRLRSSAQVMLPLAPAMRARTDGMRSSSAAARVRLCSHCPSRPPSAQQAPPLGEVLRADAMGENQICSALMTQCRLQQITQGCIP